MLCGLEDSLGVPDPAGPTSEQLELICAAVGSDEEWTVAAAADAVDRKCHAIFCDDWGQEHPDPFTPTPGELYPVPSWSGPDGWEYSRNPKNFTSRPDEFPHVRAYEPLSGFTKPVEIVFDASAEAELAAALMQLDTLAGVHPNEKWRELAMSDGSSAYPVRPVNERQLDILKQGITVALSAGSQVVVVPELAVTTQIAAELHDWLAQEVPYAVVVTGSYHTDDDGEPANIANVNIGGSTKAPHRKIVPFTSDVPGSQPSREGIQPGPRRIVVHVCGGYRFATVICKDFLDADVRHALARAGVNVLAVPAMSLAMDSYPAEVDGYVLASQGAAVVANNPNERPNTTVIRPSFVFGQPKRTATSVAQQTDCTWPFVSIFQLGDEEARCVPIN